MVVKAKKAKNPPIFSHEFVIQNHADIVAVAATVFIVGLMVEFLRPISTSFIAPQHNVTFEDNVDEYGDPAIFYRSGPKDLLAVFFYTLIMILSHAVIQEFILDKVNKKLHLSKVKFAKFNESGQLLMFYAFSFGYAANLLYEYVTAEQHYTSFLSSLWTGYPEQHSLMPWHMKIFYILQMAYWVHIFPELYLQRTKKEDMPAKIQYATLYLIAILVGYIMSYQRIMLILLALHYLVEISFHLARIVYFVDQQAVANVLFTIWKVVFAVVRLMSVALSVLTFWFGFERVHAENPTSSTSVPIRASALTGVFCLQAWMTWNFITFQMRRMKDGQEAVKSAKQPKKSTKSANGVAAKKKN